MAVLSEYFININPRMQSYTERIFQVRYSVFTTIKYGDSLLTKGSQEASQSTTPPTHRAPGLATAMSRFTPEEYSLRFQGASGKVSLLAHSDSDCSSRDLHSRIESRQYISMSMTQLNLEKESI